MSDAEHHRIAIIGAGFSGLSAAHRLGELARDNPCELQVDLFEAGDHAGGLVGTTRLDGYLVETGADAFITSKPWAVEMCRKLGLEDQLIGNDPRYSGLYVLRNGRPLRVPDGFNLVSPARVGPILRSPLFSWAGKLRMGMERWVPRRTDPADESLASFVTRRVGHEAFERLVQPLIGGIYTSDPDRLSMQATLARFVDMEREYGSLTRGMRAQQSGKADSPDRATGVRYGMFATLKQGMGHFLQRLTDEVSRTTRLHWNTRVDSIRRPPESDSTDWMIQLHDGSIQRYSAVIVATSAPAAARLLAEASPELGGQINAIEHASSAIIASGHRLSDFDHPFDAYGLIVPHIEKRRILAVSFTSRKYPDRAPEGEILLRTFIGGAMQPELYGHSDDQLIQIMHEELRDLFGMRNGPRWTKVIRYGNAMPQYHIGHLDRVTQIRSTLAGIQGLGLAGNAYEGVGVPDVIHSGQLSAEKIWDDRFIRQRNP